MTLEQKCLEIIQEDNLCEPNRKSHIIHKKAYLVYKLRNYDLKWIQIADMFDMTHGSIIHLYNNAQYWEKSKDYLYMYDTHLYREIIENIPKAVIERNLEKDIFECRSMYQLERIKERMVKKFYETNDANLSTNDAI
jgi:hypothetical protein